VAIKIRKKKEVVEVEAPEELAQEAFGGSDKFVKTSMDVSSWFAKNWKPIVAAIVVLVVVVAGISLYGSYRESSLAKESAELNRAIVASEMNLRTFAVDAKAERARHETVLAQAKSAIEKWPKSEIAGEAHLMAAVASLRLGEMEAAKSHFEVAHTKVDQSIDVFVLQANAVLHLENGAHQEAIATYRQLYAKSPRLYGAFALMQIGAINEGVGALDEAADAYAEVAARFPESDEGTEAKRRLSALVSEPEARISAVPID